MIYTNPPRPVTIGSLKLVTSHVRYSCTPPSPEQTPPQNTSSILNRSHTGLSILSIYRRPELSLSDYGIISNSPPPITSVTIIRFNSLLTSNQLSFLLGIVVDFSFTSIGARLSCYSARHLNLPADFPWQVPQGPVIYLFSPIPYPGEYLLRPTLLKFWFPCYPPLRY